MNISPTEIWNKWSSTISRECIFHLCYILDKARTLNHSQLKAEFLPPIGEGFCRERYKNLTLQISSHYFDDQNKYIVRIQVGRQFVDFDLFIKDLEKRLDDISLDILIPALERLPCVIEARHRAFKRRKMDARSKARAARGEYAHGH